MLFKHLIYFASLTGYVTASSLDWAPCGTNTTLPTECSNFTVPLDYTRSDARETLDLQLLKVPALKQPRKGTILVNFGGPGLEARYTLAEMGEILQALTGGHYDLVAHDPRGTANTLTAKCMDNDTERREFLKNLRFGDLAQPSDAKALGRQWATAAVFSNTCSNSSLGEKGALMSTAFAARDLMRIAEAVDEDGLLRYWGFSYGTTLGATVAAMFPDKMDKVILDGNMNVHEYFTGFDKQVWADVDMVFSSFFDQCLKSADKCALSTRNMTAFDLEKTIYNLIDDIRVNPLIHEQNIIDDSLLKTYIRSSLYSPPVYPALSSALNSLLNGNTSAFMKIYNAQMSGDAIFGDILPNDAPFAIQCADKKIDKSTLSDILPDMYDMVGQSRLLGEVAIGLTSICTQWKVKAKERYSGNFDVKTKNPMLVIGNTYDSATPLRCARNTTATFEGSVLLEHGGWGHATLAHGSSCTSKAIRDFWINGSLPEHGTVCPPDYAPFESGSLREVLVKNGWIKGE
ncbi:hypothetical protein MW887_011389 [Aspergillus wentii]|nr:hypothetical protein MW887_011389 [Aspergillus wentii]